MDTDYSKSERMDGASHCVPEVLGPFDIPMDSFVYAFPGTGGKRLAARAACAGIHAFHTDSALSSLSWLRGGIDLRSAGAEGPVERSVVTHRDEYLAGFAAGQARLAGDPSRGRLVVTNLYSRAFKLGYDRARCTLAHLKAFHSLEGSSLEKRDMSSDLKGFDTTSEDYRLPGFTVTIRFESASMARECWHGRVPPSYSTLRSWELDLNRPFVQRRVDTGLNLVLCQPRALNTLEVFGWKRLFVADGIPQCLLSTRTMHDILVYGMDHVPGVSHQCINLWYRDVPPSFTDTRELSGIPERWVCAELPFAGAGGDRDGPLPGLSDSQLEAFEREMQLSGIDKGSSFDAAAFRARRVSIYRRDYFLEASDVLNIGRLVAAGPLARAILASRR